MNMSKGSAVAAATFFLLPYIQAAHAQDALPMLHRAKEGSRSATS